MWIKCIFRVSKYNNELSNQYTPQVYRLLLYSVYMKKQIIIAFALGAIFAGFCFYVWQYYKLIKQVSTNTASINEIVNYINKNLAPNPTPTGSSSPNGN